MRCDRGMSSGPSPCITSVASAHGAVMKVQVEFWGVMRRLSGAARRDLELDDNANVQALMKALGEQSDLAIELPRCAFAIGADLVPASHPLRDGDCIAVLPPVSGG